MRPSTARVLATAALLVALLSLRVAGAGATPETTCAAAAARDRRVDYGFCVSRLSHHHDSPDADTWGLAKVAADVGVATAGDAVYDIKALLASKPPADAQARAALEQCQRLYDAAGLAFAEAYDGINRRDYAAGKGKAAEAASLARWCGDAFAQAAVRPPPQVAPQSNGSVGSAYIHRLEDASSINGRMKWVKAVCMHFLFRHCQHQHLLSRHWQQLHLYLLQVPLSRMFKEFKQCKTIE